MSLLYYAIPLPEPRVSSCKENFVGWPFKGLSASPAVSPQWTEIPMLFKALCYLNSFPSFGAIGWGAHLGV